MTGIASAIPLMRATWKYVVKFSVGESVMSLLPPVGTRRNWMSLVVNTKEIAVVITTATAATVRRLRSSPRC